MPFNPERLRHQVATESATLAAHGWMRGTAGNVSAVTSIDPLRLVVTASGLDKGELAPEDIVEVDEHGLLTHATDHKPSAEAHLHAQIAALTGAHAVVHVHNVPAVLAAELHPEGVRLRDIEMLKGIGRPAHDEDTIIPVVRNSQDMAELGSRVRKVYEPSTPLVIVAGHGMYAWGKTVRQARHFTESADWLLQLVVARSR